MENKRKISAKIVADSINPRGNRITTFVLTYPRFIHAELLTHRLFSRNAASSRAIPFKKMVEDVENDPFIPIAWQKDHKGMQGTEYISDPDDIKDCIELWKDAAIYAAKIAKELNGVDKNPYVGGNSEHLNVTKQLCNRLLEPFQWYTCLVTATEFDNFFNLRCPQYSFGKNTDNPRIWKSKKDAIKDFPDWENRNDLFWYSINESQAEIHMQVLAEAMWDAMNESTPKQLKAGEWHIPYGDNINDLPEDLIWGKAINADGSIIGSPLINTKLKIATSRAARISYTTLGDNPKIDYKADIKLHDRLLKDKHLSCFEHCARAMSEEEYDRFFKGEIPNSFVNNPSGLGWCNNIKGFIQYRYLLESGNC